MNLALLIGHFPPGSIGGAEIQAEHWATRLSARHRVTVITRQDAADRDGRVSRDGTQAAGYVVRRLPVSGVPLLRTALDLARIADAVAAISPRPDLLLCFQTFVSGLAGVRLQGPKGIPAVVWIRGEEEYRLSGSRVTRWLAPRVWSAARGVLVQSAANRDALLEALAHSAPDRLERVRERLEVIPNGIALPEAVAPPQGPGVLAVGRLIPEKGMDLVIDALANTGVELTIAGAGPERERLERRAERGGTRVRFVGLASRPQLDALYRASRCVVLASRRGEGMPNVVLEAMAHGRPVVATPVAGVRDLVRDGVNGVLVPLDDVAALREAVVGLVRDDARAARLGEAARATVLPFAWDPVERRLETVLERWRRP